jgi:hypothetical protein
MARHKPILAVTNVPTTAHSTPAAILYTTTFTDQALTSLTTTSTRWGPVLLSVTNESTPVIFASPV